MLGSIYAVTVDVMGSTGCSGGAVGLRSCAARSLGFPKAGDHNLREWQHNDIDTLRLLTTLEIEVSSTNIVSSLPHCGRTAI